MRTFLDTSPGYGTPCVINVKGGGDKYAISAAVSFLKEKGTHDFDAGRIPSLRSRQWWMRSSSVCQMIALSSKSCQKRQFPRVMRVWVLWRVAQSPARTNSSVATPRRRSIRVNRWCYSSMRAVACETRHLAVEQISAPTEWCDRVRKFERSVTQKTIDAIW